MSTASPDLIADSRYCEASFVLAVGNRDVGGILNRLGSNCDGGMLTHDTLGLDPQWAYYVTIVTHFRPETALEE